MSCTHSAYGSGQIKRGGVALSSSLPVEEGREEGGGSEVEEEENFPSFDMLGVLE